MSDIVERLRREATFAGDVRFDAADKIERLRGQLAQVLDQIEEWGNVAVLLCGSNDPDGDVMPNDLKKVIKEFWGNKERIEELVEVLELTVEAPGEIQKIMSSNELVIDDLDNPMQKLAFTIYTKLVAIADVADRALGDDDE